MIKGVFLAAILTAVLCFSGNLLADSGSFSWQLVSNMMTARDQFAGCVIGDKIYVFGGNGNGDEVNLRSGEVYDINISSWSSIAVNTHNDPDDGIEELSGVGLNGKFYVFGGMGDGPSDWGGINFNEMYDPITDTWTTLAQKPTTTSSTVPAVYDGKIYLFGGYYDEGPSGDIESTKVEAYDPAANSWQYITDIPKLLSDPAVAVDGNSAYIIGGYDVDANAMNTEVMVYNFASNTWTRNYCVAPTEAARVYSYASITPVINGKAYLIGGIEGTDANNWTSNKFTLFNIASRTWESQPVLPEARSGHLVVVHDETLYVIGGYVDDEIWPKSSVYAFLKPVNLNGQYWFGSLSAGPWSKQGTVVINGNNWVQEWDDQSGHHTFSSTFTTSVQPDGSINVNLSSGPYNVAWNGDVMIHTGSVLGGSGQGIDIFTRKANDIDVNDIAGEYCNFGHSLDYIGDWDISWDEDAWGTFVLDVNGTLYGTSTDSKGVTGSGSTDWDFNSINNTIYIDSNDSVNFAMPCKDGLILAATAGPDGGGGMGYQLFVKKVDDIITCAEMAGTYQVRFLETGPATGAVYTCGKGTCIIDANGTMHVDAWYSDGTHDVFDSNYTLGPGNMFSITGTPEQGIISPDKNLILMPEYICSNPRNSDDWIGGIFLIRNTTPAFEPNDIADFNGDGVVDFIDLKKFCEHWLETGCIPPYGCEGTDLDNDTKVNFKDYAIFAQHWLDGQQNISDNVFEIGITTEWDYEAPGVTDDTYVIDVEGYTDDTVDRIKFTTPAGITFEIPNAPMTRYPIAGGYMEIGREFDSNSGQYLWLYGPGFSSPDSLSAYGDGLYSFTFYYTDGRHQHTTAWYGVPGTSDTLPQPTQIPIFTSFNHGDTVASPVTFTWESCTDDAAENIWLDVKDGEDNEIEGFLLPLSAEGLDEPLALSAGLHEAELDFIVYYDSINEDGIAVNVYKYSESDYYFTVESTPIPGDFEPDGDVDFADLMILANQWLQPPSTPSADIAPQPNGDGIVNFLDFAILVDNWLEGL